MRGLILVALCACQAPTSPFDDYFDDGAFMLENSHANVLRKFSFTRELEPGVAEGFDLDDQSSPDGEAESCGHGDRTSPDGVGGIDNQFAEVWGLAEPLIGEAVEGLLQGAINEGRFLLMLELEGADNLEDDEVTLHLFRGSADPLVGAQGLILPDQTFRVDDSIAPSVVEGVRIEDGRLSAGPIAFQLPIDILEANFIADVKQGRIQLEIDEDGNFAGILGGVLNVPDMMNELLATDAAAEAALVQPLFESNADMGFDGTACHELSVAFGFEGTTGFVVRTE